MQKELRNVLFSFGIVALFSGAGMYAAAQQEILNENLPIVRIPPQAFVPTPTPPVQVVDVAGSAKTQAPLPVKKTIPVPTTAPKAPVASTADTTVALAATQNKDAEAAANALAAQIKAQQDAQAAADARAAQLQADMAAQQAAQYAAQQAAAQAAAQQQAQPAPSRSTRAS